MMTYTGFYNSETTLRIDESMYNDEVWFLINDSNFQRYLGCVKMPSETYFATCPFKDLPMYNDIKEYTVSEYVEAKLRDCQSMTLETTTGETIAFCFYQIAGYGALKVRVYDKFGNSIVAVTLKKNVEVLL